MNVHHYQIAALTFALLMTGCGSSQSQPEGIVRGKVLFEGKPVTQGLVDFFSSDLGTGARAELAEDGTYSLPKAVPLGEYAVSVRGPEETPDNPKPIPTQIPKKFWLAHTSGLTFNVVPGTSTFDLNLTKSSPK